MKKITNTLIAIAISEGYPKWSHDESVRELAILAGSWPHALPAQTGVFVRTLWTLRNWELPLDASTRCKPLIDSFRQSAWYLRAIVKLVLCHPTWRQALS